MGSRLSIYLSLFLIFSLSNCANHSSSFELELDEGKKHEISYKNGLEADMIKVDLVIDGVSYTALFYDNETSRAFIAQMPRRVHMKDLNNNEKYDYLPENLPAENTECPAIIQAGDIMCWSSNCLVLFYESFSNSYDGYVKLGYIEDAKDLATILGPGTIAVTFSIAE